MKTELKRWLENKFGPLVSFDEPMAGHTTFGIGGPANIVTVETEQQLQELIQWSKATHQPVMILGAGSNLLVRDGGIRGIVVRLGGDFASIREAGKHGATAATHLTVGSGVSLRKLCRHALKRGLAGLNFALGIPGTVGGAIKMNAGAWGNTIADSLSAVITLNRQGKVETVSRDRLQFSYRQLRLAKGEIILRAAFVLYPMDPLRLREEARRIVKRRYSRQPVSVASAGCFFRNPTKGPSAGELIDRAGLKGAKVGHAAFSNTHANFVVNTGGATASDVITLTQEARTRVREAFGVELKREVIVVGEEET